MNLKFNLSFIFILAISALIMTGCATQNLFQTNHKNWISSDTTFNYASPTHLIRVDDKISVSIWNHDDLSVGSLFGIYNSNEVYGKWILVNKEGFVNLPKIGAVKLEGLDANEASEYLKSIYAKYIVDPVVVVKVLNKEVIVLGEIMTPGAYILEKEQNTIFEMIGRAGGLDFYSDKKHVILIREEKEYFLDLTSMEDFHTNNILVKSGDVIYIPTRKGKMMDKKAPTVLSISSVVTSIIVIFSFLNK